MKNSLIAIFLTSLLFTGFTFTTSEPEPKMDISTAGRKEVSQSANNRCAVDINYGSSAFNPKMKDLMYGAYHNTLDSTYSSEYAWSGGSTSWEAHVIIGDTTVYGGRGVGYNCHNCESFGGICCAASVSKDFFNDYTVFARSKGTGIIANMSASWDELQWMVDRTNAAWVVLGLEGNLGVYDDIFPNGKSYVEKANLFTDSLRKYYPGIYVISDAPPVNGGSRRNLDFRNEIGKYSTADAVRMYLWDIDYTGLMSRDWEQNLDTVNDVFATIMPADLAKMKEQFPGKEIAVLQWGMKNQTGYETGMSQTVLGQNWLAKEMKFILDNNIKVASYMSLKALIGTGDVLNNNGYTMQLIGKWFASVDSVAAVTFTNLKGITGFVGVKGKNNYSVVIVNDNSYAVDIPIFIDGQRKKKKDVTTYSIYGTSLESQSLLFSTKESTGTFTAPQYSVSWAKF